MGLRELSYAPLRAADGLRLDLCGGAVNSRTLFLLLGLLALLPTALACSDDDGGNDADAGGNEPAQKWQLVFHDLDPALMSVSGSAADDVWAVGADSRDGKGALV